jgi:hypothetical protein
LLTSVIEQHADMGSISHPDLNIKALLRRNVVPGFFQDVGYVSWRRKQAAQALTVGIKQLDLPEDFGFMQRVAIDLDDPLEYIGEDPVKILAAEANVTAGVPRAYYLVHRPGTEVFKRLALDCPPSAADTLRYSYYTHVVFVDDLTDVEMDKYIPAQFQWVLVEGLKAQILWLRFGVGDPRYQAADAAYKVWVSRALENPELARRNQPVFVR